MRRKRHSAPQQGSSNAEAEEVSCSRSGKWSPKMRGQHSISDAADQSGISEATLRVWEERYGWPTPGRGSNGYRVYSDKQVAALKAVGTLTREGRGIGDLLADESLGLLKGKVPDLSSPRRSSIRADLDFSAIPLPSSPEALRIRAGLEDALRYGNSSVIAQLESEALRLRPSDRQAILRLRQHVEAQHSDGANARSVADN